MLVTWVMQIAEITPKNTNYRFVAGKGMQVGINLCLMCVHYRKDKKCNAFPEGIPHDIWILKIIHKKSIPGDNGIVFKPLPEYDTSIENLKETYDRLQT